MSLLSDLWAGQSWLLGCPSRQNLLPPSVGAVKQAEAPLLFSGAGGTIAPCPGPSSGASGKDWK